MAPAKPGSVIGHTAKYLAAKLRDNKAAREKRRDANLASPEEAEQPAVKKPKHDVDYALTNQVKKLTTRALQQWTDQMNASTDQIYVSLYGEHWEEGKKYELEKLVAKQADAREQQVALAESARKQRESDRVMTNTGIYKDDCDPRLS